MTTVEIEAPTLADLSLDAWRRLACFYIVTRLSGRALNDACESLGGIYSWQLEQMRPVPQIPEQKLHAVSHLRRVERTPFVFDED